LYGVTFNIQLIVDGIVLETTSESQYTGTTSFDAK